MGSARQDAEHALAHPTSPHGSDAVYCELARAYLGLLGKHEERCSQVSRLAAETALLTAEVERLQSGVRGAVHRLRRGIDACGLDDNARSAEVFCAADMLAALAREDGA